MKRINNCSREKHNIYTQKLGIIIPRRQILLLSWTTFQRKNLQSIQIGYIKTNIGMRGPRTLAILTLAHLVKTQSTISDAKDKAIRNSETVPLP